MDQTKIGNYIRKKRIESAMTQNDLAEKLGVSTKTVSRWETGSNMPDLSVLNILADAIDVSVAELLKGEDSEEHEEKPVDDENTQDAKLVQPATHSISKFKTVVLVLLIISLVLLIDTAYGYFSTQLNWTVSGGDFYARGLLFRLLFGKISVINHKGVLLTKTFNIFIAVLITTAVLLIAFIVLSILEKRAIEEHRC